MKVFPQEGPSVAWGYAQGAVAGGSSKYSMWEFKNAAGFSTQPYGKGGWGGGSLGYKYVNGRERILHIERGLVQGPKKAHSFNPLP